MVDYPGVDKQCSILQYVNCNTKEIYCVFMHVHNICNLYSCVYFIIVVFLLDALTAECPQSTKDDHASGEDAKYILHCISVIV